MHSFITLYDYKVVQKNCTKFNNPLTLYNCLQ